MKSISAPAMAAIEAGEAIVTGAVEITPRARAISIFQYDTTFDYHIVDSVIDADPPESIVVPSVGFGSSGTAPFGRDDTLTPLYPVVTDWPEDKSLWLRKEIELDFDGILTLSGHYENGVVFFLDDALVGSFNPENVNIGDPSGTPYTLDISVTAGTHTIKVLALDEATTAADDNTYIYVQAVLTVGGTDAAIRLWGGHGLLTIDGEVYTGIGDRGLAQQTAGAVGGFAQGLVLTLSGIEPEVLELLDADEIKGGSVVIRRLIFASDGKTLLDESVFDRGRVDTVETAETIGGAAEIRVAVETAARGLGRSGARQRADSDQRLINPNDGYFKNAAYAGEKMLYWGGRRPYRSGSTSTSGGSVSSGEFLQMMQSRSTS